ncbi:MAG: deoxyhypusine synthase family protein [Candidatus Diapherotrites archaeon]|nr:deoxyhypusine synthase family protein [Candidatus Diapherotrites archaeon]
MASQNYFAVKEFIDRNFRHFNAYALKAASQAYVSHIKRGGKMLIAIAGAMSTAELGITLAEMIRRNKVHAISCTGANLEEDIFNLVAHNFYEHVPNYRQLSTADEERLYKKHLNRVTDTCIPEEEAIRRIEKAIVSEWRDAERKNMRLLPHEFFYRIFEKGTLKKYYQIDPKDSWVLAAYEKRIPLFVPGWEDSTIGNIFAAHCIAGDIKNPNIVRSGIEYMIELAKWYLETSARNSIGFFQIGGGIAGDFPICVVPMIEQDLGKKVKKWGYFCQISDSTTSYGSYSGAVPNEKITWGKLAVDTPKFIIESDATIVAPLIFSYVLANR